MPGVLIFSAFWLASCASWAVDALSLLPAHSSESRALAQSALLQAYGNATLTNEILALAEVYRRGAGPTQVAKEFSSIKCHMSHMSVLWGKIWGAIPGVALGGFGVVWRGRAKLLPVVFCRWQERAGSLKSCPCGRHFTQMCEREGPLGPPLCVEAAEAAVGPAGRVDAPC